jgi:hypothetical protein
MRIRYNQILLKVIGLSGKQLNFQTPSLARILRICGDIKPAP